MSFTSLRLQHFRSYNDAVFDFKSDVNIIVGPNASGKTNLLEAVLVIARGGSYRAKDVELVQFGQDWARLDAMVDDQPRTVKLQHNPGFSKTFDIDSKVVSRLHQSKTLPVVLFEPNHLLLLSSSPDLRRTFMDDLIEQTTPGFGATRRHYRRVLSQRNSLLKQRPHGLAQELFVWNVRLSELGGQIAKQRSELVQRFNERITELYDTLAGRQDHVELAYSSRFAPDGYETALLHKLEASTELDALRGFTAYGPHRDDLAMHLDGHRVQETASRGETRTMVLALKLLELQLLEDMRGQRPLLLLDDVFSELDKSRRQALTHFVRDYQSFITTTDADIVAHHFDGSNTIALAAA